MNKILIWGDSWGEPNWRNPQPGFTAEGHTSSRLRTLGYDVENLSESGQGNLVSIQRKPHTRPDWIVWFHTELPRDFDIGAVHHHWRYNEFCDRTAERVYSLAAKRLHELGNPVLIVIEGQAPLWPGYEQHFTPYKTIPWKEQLLGTSLPHSHLTATWDLLNTPLNRDSTATRHSLTRDAHTILELMKSSNYFTDNCHPNDVAHEMLTLTLDRLFRGLDQKQEAFAIY